MAVRSTHHVVAEGERFGARLTDRLQRSEGGDVVLATAFFTHGAFQEIRDRLVSALEAGTSLTALLGRFDFITEPRGVRALLKLAGKYPTQVRVLFDRDYGFHYKLALFRHKGQVAVLLGSSNLTPKGLSGAGEINAEILNQWTLYRDLLKDVNARVARGELAIDALPDYERRYRQAKKWRDARFRAEKRGYARWKHASRTLLTPRRLSAEELSPLAHCNVNFLSDDQVLKKNAAKRRREDQRQGLSFPSAWIETPASFARRLKEGDTFLISDDIDRVIGLATVKALPKVMAESGREVKLIFYRYQPGRKLKLPSQERYAKVCAEMHLGAKEVLKRDATATALKVLQRLVKRAAK